MGIADSLIRLSVGIEDPEDLMSDFDAALTGTTSRRDGLHHHPQALTE
jgi:hypothetical protein